MTTTISDFTTTVTRLGHLLQVRRQAVGMPPAVLAAGICAQSMITQIEQGTEIPNAILLARLCDRLGLPLAQGLKQNYPIRRLPIFSRKVHRLYAQRKFAELMAYMEKPEKVKVLKTDEDLKTYYYYYSCAVYQATQDTATALRNLHTARTMMIPQRPNRYRTLELLIMAMENSLQALITNKPDFSVFDDLLRIIREKRLLEVNENIGIIYNQYARTCLALNQPERAIPVLIEGIKWTVAQNSQYLLLDDYYLLVQAYAGTQPVASAAKEVATTFKPAADQGELS
ncbi:helix-turn-helix domain-containing protein [Levilactobacillus brevis]|nr:helix-turn-helix domain-containing protein [Levilactobacillus brevis]